MYLTFLAARVSGHDKCKAPLDVSGTVSESVRIAIPHNDL